MDPTAEDPWRFLFFVSATGVVTPRFDPSTGRETPKGRATVDILPLNDEAVTDGRIRVHRRLAREVRRFLDAPAGETDAAGRTKAGRELLDSALDSLQYGVACWCFARDGQAEEPFSVLKERFPDLFAELRRRIEAA